MGVKPIYEVTRKRGYVQMAAFASAVTGTATVVSARGAAKNPRSVLALAATAGAAVAFARCVRRLRIQLDEYRDARIYPSGW